MNRLLTTSTMVIAICLLCASSGPARNSRPNPQHALSMSRRVAPETRSFAYERGKDGVGGETITRDGGMIRGDMAIGAKHAQYEGRVAADGTIPRLEIRAWRSAAEAKHPRILTAILNRDSTMIIEHLTTHVDTLRFASRPGTIPVINPSMGLLEVVVARARGQKSQSATIPILLIDALDLDSPNAQRIGAGPQAVTITFLAADTVKLANGKSTDQMRIIVGADGRVRGATNGTTANDKFSMRPTSKRVSPND